MRFSRGPSISQSVSGTAAGDNTYIAPDGYAKDTIIPLIGDKQVSVIIHKETCRRIEINVSCLSR
jgi:hypothetical protein